MKSRSLSPRLIIAIIFLCMALFLQRLVLNGRIEERDAMIDSLMTEVMDSEMQLLYIVQMIEGGSSVVDIHNYIEQLLGVAIERTSAEPYNGSEMQAELDPCPYDTVQPQPGYPKDSCQRVWLHSPECVACSAR